MWSPQEDPLGLGLQQKAAQRRFQMAVQGLQPQTGPLPDPRWDAFFEATQEAGGGHPMKFGNEFQQETNDLSKLYPTPTVDLSRSKEGENAALSEQLGARVIKGGGRGKGLRPALEGLVQR